MPPDSGLAAACDAHPQRRRVPAASTGPAMRKETRYRVHLNVRYQVAGEFVKEYAENLSSGGLFVRGASKLQDGDTVHVQVDLPGFMTVTVEAIVVHVLSPAAAHGTGRNPGVGLCLVGMDRDMESVFHDYLLRLHRRVEFAVMVQHDDWKPLLTAAGFTVIGTPALERFGDAFCRAPLPVIGVLVGRADHGAYAREAAQHGFTGIVPRIHFTEELDDVLAALDHEIARRAVPPKR